MTRLVSTTALAMLSFLLAVPAAAQFGVPAPQIWTQALFPMSPGEGVESGDHFGTTLASGDFNGDGFDDLAIGHPYLKVAGFSSSGAVHVLSGSVGGLTLELDSIDQSRLLGGSPGSGDTFGLALASGRFNDGPLGDLAIGAPGKTVGAAPSAGAVWVLRGTTQGLNRLGYVRLVPHPTHALAAGDRFGASLAAGDINRDGRDELAVGVPGRSRMVAGRRLFGVGQVDLYYGSASGIVANSVAYLDQSLTGELEQSDTFGSTLALGDTSGDGRAELYAGVPNENGAGAYQRFLTGLSGISPTGSSLVLQPGSGESEAGDRFAAALVLGDFDGNGLLDLATSAPSEDLGLLSNAGQVHVKYHERPLVVSFYCPESHYGHGGRWPVRLAGWSLDGRRRSGSAWASGLVELMEGGQRSCAGALP